MNITIALSDIKTQGGAKLFFDNIVIHLSQYNWNFTQTIIPHNTDILIYGNKHEFYTKAKALGIPKIIQRTQGQRALHMPQPEDLSAVVCSSKKSYSLSSHPNKIFICNGIDFDLAAGLKPILSDLLVAESRISKGQQVEKSIQWAINNNRKLTILGSKQHSIETVEDELKRKYPQCNWIGLVDYPTSLRYIKGCNELIVASSAHGLSNSVLAATHFGKAIVNLGGVEEIDYVPDTKETAKLYKQIIEK